MYYPFESRIIPLTTIRRERLLPVPGQVLVGPGEMVGPADVVARCQLPGRVRVVDVSQALGIRRERAARCVRVNAGDTVQVEDVLAMPGGLFGRLRGACRSPVNGEVIDVRDGLVLIESSATPEPTTDIGLAEMRLMQGDIDIRGNLATWNTGLKNWVHLPWHPPEDPTDLNGVYTIRLVVEGKDGEIIEDRMTVEIGRVIAQCLPGIAVSPDQRVMMRFPEQSLVHPFRIYTILPLSEVGETASLPPGECHRKYTLWVPSSG